MSGIEIVSQALSGLPLVKASTYSTAKDVPYSRDLDSRTYTGTYGAVYKTFDPSGRAYAVKEVSTEQRFRRRESHSIEGQIVSEITMLGQCNHKNVLRLVEAYEVETIKDTFYLVTEPWAPTTLRDFFMKLSRDGTTSPYPWWIADEKHDIVLQICLGFIDGLSYLHGHSIKHKDIKPENLLLHCPPYESDQTPRVLPVIADFGISKLYRRGGQTMFTGATVEYLAPEQINHVESGLKADIFSMGCCFLLVFAAACEGGNGVERVEDLVIDVPGSCQYGREIKRILPVLYEMIRTIQQSEEEPRAKLTRLGLAVRDMLIEAPAKRLSARSTRHALVEGEGLLPAQHLFLDQEWRCYKGRVIKDSFVLGVNIIGASDQLFSARLSLDTGSSINAISTELLESIQLPPQSVRALQPAVEVYALGLGHIQLTQEVTLTLARAGARANLGHDPRFLIDRFLVIPQAWAGFQLLLGGESIFNLDLLRMSNDMVAHIDRDDVSDSASDSSEVVPL